MLEDQPIAPLFRLIAAYAPAGERERHRLLWMLDAKLADIVRTTREPMIGRMRLTWWHDALTGAAGEQGRAQPLVGALVRLGLAAEDVAALIDGWEALLDPDLTEAALGEHAGGRGRLFAMIAGGRDAALDRAGAGWAAWDLSGHVGDAAIAGRATALAAAMLADSPRIAPKPLRILAGLARRDALRGRAAPATLTPRQYLALLRLALVG